MGPRFWNDGADHFGTDRAGRPFACKVRTSPTRVSRNPRMFHSNTETLIKTWRARRRSGARLPTRTDLSPIDLGAFLPQVLILGRQGDGEETFRLSGGLIADLHGRDLRGSSFYSLWSKFDRPQVAAALARSRSGAAPVVITLDAVSVRGETIGIELCLAPMMGPSGEADRTLGLYQPISTVARLMGAPIEHLRLRSVALAVDPAPGPRLRLVVDNTRRVA